MTSTVEPGSAVIGPLTPIGAGAAAAAVARAGERRVVARGVAVSSETAKTV